MRVGSMEGTLSPSQSSARDSDEDVDDDDVYAEVDPLQEARDMELVYGDGEVTCVASSGEALFTVPWPLPKRQRRAKLRKKRGRRMRRKRQIPDGAVGLSPGKQAPRYLIDDHPHAAYSYKTVNLKSDGELKLRRRKRRKRKKAAPNLSFVEKPLPPLGGLEYFTSECVPHLANSKIMKAIDYTYTNCESTGKKLPDRRTCVWSSFEYKKIASARGSTKPREAKHTSTDTSRRNMYTGRNDDERFVDRLTECAEGMPKKHDIIENLFTRVCEIRRDPDLRQAIEEEKQLRSTVAISSEKNFIDENKKFAVDYAERRAVNMQQRVSRGKKAMEAAKQRREEHDKAVAKDLKERVERQQRRQEARQSKLRIAFRKRTWHTILCVVLFGVKLHRTVYKREDATGTTVIQRIIQEAEARGKGNARLSAATQRSSIAP